MVLELKMWFSVVGRAGSGVSSWGAVVEVGVLQTPAVGSKGRLFLRCDVLRPAGNSLAPEATT